MAGTTRTKRTADTKITHLNWEKEEEPGKPGAFVEATDEVLGERKIIRGKRRADATEDDKKIKTTFGSFSGFMKTDNLNPFEVNKKPVEENKNLKNFWTTSTPSTDFFIKEDKPKSKFTNNADEHKNLSGKPSDVDAKSWELYLQDLSNLNVSFLDWIKHHVDSNACIDLTPVFEDYKKHISEIDTRLDKNKNKVDISLPTKDTTVKQLNANNEIIDTETTKKENGLSLKETSQLPTKAESSQSTDDVNNDDETPSVQERKTVVEKDAFHQIRCKLYFKKGENFQELGLGMLYLKPNGENTQLLIRMENATGKVLLNVGISKEMPMSRKGKNNVMLVSVPNPPVYLKPNEGDNSVPCTYLIRVKTADDADKLLEKMKS